MKIYHIAALSENHVIAKDGDIPWHIEGDLPRFAEITKGHPIIMGMGTFRSMRKRPLKDRRNIVLSRADAIVFDGVPYSYDGEPFIEISTDRADVVFCRTIEDAFLACAGRNEVYVIGGGTIYEQTLKHTDELRLTIVHRDIEEDDTCVYYPEIDDDTWAISFVETYDTHSYVDYVRRQG